MWQQWLHFCYFASIKQGHTICSRCGTPLGTQREAEWADLVESSIQPKFLGFTARGNCLWLTASKSTRSDFDCGANCVCPRAWLFFKRIEYLNNNNLFLSYIEENKQTVWSESHDDGFSFTIPLIGLMLEKSGIECNILSLTVFKL